MKRAVVFPALFVASVAYAYLTGMAWPICMTFWRLIQPEPATETTEADYPA